MYKDPWGLLGTMGGRVNRGYLQAFPLLINMYAYMCICIYTYAYMFQYMCFVYIRMHIQYRHTFTIHIPAVGWHVHHDHMRVHRILVLLPHVASFLYLRHEDTLCEEQVGKLHVCMHVCG